MFNIFKSNKSSKDNTQNLSQSKAQSGSEINKVKVSSNLNDNLASLIKIFEKCDDLIIRKLNIPTNSNITAALLYLDKMFEDRMLEEAVIQKFNHAPADIINGDNIKVYPQRLLGLTEKHVLFQMTDVVNGILSGDSILFIDGVEHALGIFTKEPPSRSIQEPQIETVVRGPREGFTELISININLIRKKIKNSNLKVERIILGAETKTELCIMYLSNISNPKIVEEVKNRLSKMEIDSVLGATYISNYIQDTGPFAIAPTIFKTEKPDVAASKILEGRVAIMVDGTPTILVVPCVFIEFLHSSEDYYTSSVIASFYRIIRLSSMLISLLLPAFWVSILIYHQELIPTALVESVVKARSNVPFSSLWETFLMMAIFEILREAGIRMPRTVGQTVSVVGALVIGQAAVQAGLVSVPIIIIVSITSISAFTVPSPEMIDMLVIPRFAFIIIGGYSGLVGLMSAMIIFMTYLVSLRSYGTPYMAPFAPESDISLGDSIIRIPMQYMKKRPRMFTWKESTRRKPRQKN